MVSIIAALGRNREIGTGNALLWRIPDDLRRFKQLTLGHPVILGRATFESILAGLGKPLPGRTTIVITRDPDWRFEGVETAHSINEALQKAREKHPEIFVCGGAQVYTAALPFTDTLYLTHIDAAQPADAFFPEYEQAFSTEIFSEDREWQGLKYRWVTVVR